MPIEGPLRELGLQEVFQLLELSRKTGMLRVTSRHRDDEGHVYFERGRVVQANRKSRPVPPPDPSALSERELERRLRAEVEATVYDLMSWREGFFSFEERPLDDIRPELRVTIATESLLMEGARRIDEWSRIADRIPNLKVIPVLAEVAAEHESQLNLLPHEWEVLSLIDGQRDLRAIADLHGHDAFETAKVVYGLVTTGVVEIRPARRVSVAVAAAGGAPSHTPRSSPLLPLPVPARPTENPEVMKTLNDGFGAARRGDFAAARASWQRFLSLAPDHPSGARVREALEAAAVLQQAIDAHRNG